MNVVLPGPHIDTGVEPDWAPVVPVFLCLLRGPLHRIIPVFLPPKERKYGNFIWVGGTFIS